MEAKTTSEQITAIIQIRDKCVLKGGEMGETKKSVKSSVLEYNKTYTYLGLLKLNLL